MIVTFVIPNRDDVSKPPTLYEDWGAAAVPREGETVYLGDPDEVAPWVVKWVEHTFREGMPQQIRVCLVEHVVPLAHGGEHTYANVKLAHFICNTRRGTHAPSEISKRSTPRNSPVAVPREKRFESGKAA